MSLTGDAGFNVWVISDTHLKCGKDLPAAFVDNLRREDIIIHLGDFVTVDVADYLGSLARLEAVAGNCDPPRLKRSFPTSKTIELEGVRIGLAHGRGSFSETLASVRAEFDGRVDIALFGHTHAPHKCRIDRTIYFNPGSLTGGRGIAGSYGLLYLDGHDTRAEVFEI